MRWGLAALAAVALAAGCGGSRNGARVGGHARTNETWASPAELRWLRAVGAWEDQFAAAARRVAVTTNANNLAAALTPLVNCGDLLRNDVGPAPTQRLRAPYALLTRSCASWRRASLTTIDSGNANSSSVHAEVDNAASLLRRADELLPPAESRRLPRGDASLAQSRIVPLFTSVASTLSHHHAVVRCWSLADWPRVVREEREYSVSRVDQRAVGITSLSSHRISIDPQICATLGRLSHHRSVALAQASFAVEVLAHESQHAAGIANEAAADCFGMQSIERTAVLLGLPRAYGARLAAEYWRHWHALPAIYRSPACHDGGALDLHPKTSRWP